MPEETTEETEEVEEVEEVTEETAAIEFEEEEDLEETVRQQQEQIEELQDQLLDLSARVADNGGQGVCSQCNGPVVKTSGFLRSSKIECRRCGEVYHEY